MYQKICDICGKPINNYTHEFRLPKITKIPCTEYMSSSLKKIPKVTTYYTRKIDIQNYDICDECSKDIIFLIASFTAFKKDKYKKFHADPDLETTLKDIILEDA